MDEKGATQLFLRFRNCTGNLINLRTDQKINQELTEEEYIKGQIAMSVDNFFKNQRRRTVAQAALMTFRQRTISAGYFDHLLNRQVLPLTLD